MIEDRLTSVILSSQGEAQKFPVRRMERDNEGKREIYKDKDKQEIGGEFFARDDISTTVKATLMIRNKQEREGLPLPRSECSLHQKEQEGGCSIRTDGPSLGHCSFPIVTLSAGPATHPHSCNLCPLYEHQQSKQTGATSVSEEAVVFAVMSEESAGGESVQVRPQTPPPLQTQ